VLAGAGVTAGAAGRGPAVATLAGGAGVLGNVPVMDCAEGRCGERGEYDRMPCDGGGDGLAASQAGADDLEGVARVDPGAVRALRCAAVAARFVDRAVGQIVGAHFSDDAAGVGLDTGEGAGEADRASAAASGGGVFQPAEIVRSGSTAQGLGDPASGEAGPGQGERGRHRVLLTGWQGRKTKHHQPWTLSAGGVRRVSWHRRKGDLGRRAESWWCHTPPMGDVLAYSWRSRGRHGWEACDAGTRRGCRRLPYPWKVSNPGHRGRQKAVLSRSADSVADTATGRARAGGIWTVSATKGRSASQESSPAIRRRAALACSNDRQSSTGHRHVNPIVIPPVGLGRPAPGRCGRTFCTSIKAALDGPHAPPPRRPVAQPRQEAGRRANARRLARKAKAHGPPQTEWV